MSNANSPSQQIMDLIIKIILDVDLPPDESNFNRDATGPQIVILHCIKRYLQTGGGRLDATQYLSLSISPNILGRMAEKGLITQVSDNNDKQKLFIEITEKGNEALNRTPPSLTQEFIDKFHCLPESGQVQMLSSLQEISEMLLEADMSDAIKELQIN